MKVILLKDIKGTGKKGDVINASDGHARNYLLPRGLAKEATDSSIRELSHQKSSEDKRKQDELEAAQELGKRIEELSVTVRTKAGEGGKLFGAVTSKEVAELLEKSHGIKVDKKKITLAPIKYVGTTTAEIKLHQKVTVKMSVIVQGE
jgi:large subunit ribosomal protein L9